MPIDTTTVGTDENDAKYFVMTPQIVIFRCRDPYDLALWSIIKMIAAENGECTLTTKKLASLSMMSEGRVHKSREYLLATGLINGRKTRNLDGSETWHLRISKLWGENIEWREQHHTLQSRSDYRDKFKTGAADSPRERGRPHQMNGTDLTRRTGPTSPDEHEEKPLFKGNQKKRANARAPEPASKNHPAIQIFRSEMDLFPKRNQFADIINDVGDQPDDLKLWKSVVNSWKMAGWDPFNVGGMLQRFKQREIPNQGRPKSASTPARNGSLDEVNDFSKAKPWELGVD